MLATNYVERPVEYHGWRYMVSTPRGRDAEQQSGVAIARVLSSLLAQ
jgi:hypothetical protein